MTSLNEDPIRDGSLGANSANQSKGLSSRGNTNTIGDPTIGLTFPPTAIDPEQQLSALRDNHSAFSAVSKSCFLLNQYAGSGSHASTEDASSVLKSALFHDATFADTMSSSFAALIECIQTHDDRRAKILCCKTIAVVARSAYARIRHSPHLFAMRDSTLHRLEDEVGTEVPTALCNAALDDPDEGAAAAALSSLGALTLSSQGMSGSLVEDDFAREILSMTGIKPSQHAPSVSQISDEDPTVPQIELQSRIYENIIAPRLLQLVCRATAFDSSKHVESILPVLTASLVHTSKIAPILSFGMDRATHAKRWVELDFTSMINNLVQDLLLPAMQSSLDSFLAKTAAICAIRLLNACPHASWVSEVCRWTLLVFQEDYALSRSLEKRMTCLASMAICSRAQPLHERSSTLLFIFEKIVSDLPSTTMAPCDICSAGLLLQARGISQYRGPARVALLAEICISFLLDGPPQVSSQHPTTRSEAFEQFLKTGIVQKALKEKQEGKVMQVREEIILAFCMTAASIGRQYKIQNNGDKSGIHAGMENKEEFEEWLRMSLIILNTFSTCVGWGTSPTYMDEELSPTVAAQSSYVRLVQEVLHASGLLHPVSVSLRMVPTASPPNMLWDQMEESAVYLGHFHPVAPSNFMVDPISSLMGEYVKKEIKSQGIVSHHMRLFLLSLTADMWVQARRLSMRNDPNNIDPKKTFSSTIDIESAKELLQALSPRRVFSKVVESQKGEIEQYNKKKKELYKKYAQETVTVCVACIENIALNACDWRRKFGASEETKSILSFSIASLQGKTGDGDAQAPVLPVCQGAIERIQNAFNSTDPLNLDAMPLSPLVTAIEELERRPIVTASRCLQGPNSYQQGYLTQLGRQTIAARVDRAILSIPTAYSSHASARKQNWLRLNMPPLPENASSPMPTSHIPRFEWASNVTSVNGGSDTSAIVLSYSMRRNLRYDGEDEFRLYVSMRLHNTTAVDIEKGLRLELGLAQEDPTESMDAEDTLSIEIIETLKSAADNDDVGNSFLHASAVTTYKNELKCGDHITWEVCLGSFPLKGILSLHPSVVYRDMEVEQRNSEWTDEEKKEGDAAGTSETNKPDSKSESEEMENVTFHGEPMRLSPFIGLQPCPFVFFRNGSGDVDTFRFIWSRMSHQIQPLRLISSSNDDEMRPIHQDARRLAALSTLRFAGEVIPRGLVTKLWAFMSLQGQRVLCVLAQSSSSTSGNDEKETERTLHIRSDDTSLLCCVAGTQWARSATVSALVPELEPAPLKQTTRGSV